MSVVTLLVAAFGGWIADRLLRGSADTTSERILGAMALAPGLGFGLCSLGYFAWIFTGAAPPSRGQLIVVVGLFAAALLALARWTSPGAVSAETPEARPSTTRRATARRIWLLVCLAVLAAVLSGPLGRWTQINECFPEGGWDAVAIWNVRALFLYRTDGDLAEVFAQKRKGHPDYPLFLPSSIAAQYSFEGAEDPSIPQSTGLVFCLGLLAAVTWSVARLASLELGVLAGTTVASTPKLWQWAFLQVADVPLAYLWVVAVVSLAGLGGAKRVPSVPAVATGFFVGLLPWMKNEGLILAAIPCTVLVLVLWRRSGSAATRLRIGWALAGALPPVVAFVAFKVFWAPVSVLSKFVDGAFQRSLDLDRWRVVAAAFWNQMRPLGEEHWALAWVFVAVVGLVAAWRTASRRASAGGPTASSFLGWSVLLALGAYFSIYLSTHARLEWHLRTSLDRLLLQIFPLALVWVFSAVSTGDGFSEETEPPAIRDG